MSIVVEAVTVGKFAITADKDFIRDQEAPLLLPSPRDMRLVDIEEMQTDYFNDHYSTRFHDCTIKSLSANITETIDILSRVHIVSDRKCLRKIFVNQCIALPLDAFYCKREPYDIIAENINGVLYLGGRERYNLTNAGYGESFEKNMTKSVRGLEGAACYHVVQYSIGDKQPTNCIVRFEVDAVDSDGDVIELKSKKKPNPRYGLGPDFYMNIWIQMILSDTKACKIGIHNYGVIEKIDSLTLEAMQLRAGVSNGAAKESLLKLSRVLNNLRNSVPNGRQAVISLTVSGIDVKLQPAETFNLPVLSSYVRQNLSPSEPTGSKVDETTDESLVKAFKEIALDEKTVKSEKKSKS